jgi:hypothetical protein
MIKITVELVSAIHPSRSRVLGIGTIANTGKRRADGKCDYVAKLSKWAPKESQTWQWNTFGHEESEELYIEGFDNVKRGPWDLLYLALKAVVSKRNA